MDNESGAADREDAMQALTTKVKGKQVQVEVKDLDGDNERCRW